MKPSDLSESVVRALAILRAHGPLRPREFAKLMWPESEGWLRYAQCGPYGSHRGGGMYLAGGGFLGRLRHQGLVEYGGYGRGYRLSDDGRRLLKEATSER